MKTIIAISAGHDKTKKLDNPIRRKIRYLNYGLLGLATILKHLGNLDVVVFQADLYDVDELILIIENSGIDIKADCEYILLSIPSYYSISWCARFCEMVYKTYKKKIVVGGRWVVDNHVEWVKEKLKYVHTVIEGFGEKNSQVFSIYLIGTIFKTAIQNVLIGLIIHSYLTTRNINHVLKSLADVDLVVNSVLISIINA